MEKIILRGHPQDSEKNFPCVGKTKMWSSMLAKRFASAKNSGRDYGFKTILENRIMPKKTKNIPQLLQAYKFWFIARHEPANSCYIRFFYYKKRPLKMVSGHYA